MHDRCAEFLAPGAFTLGGFVVVGRFVLDQKRLAPNGVKM